MELPSWRREQTSGTPFIPLDMQPFDFGSSPQGEITAPNVPSDDPDDVAQPVAAQPSETPGPDKEHEPPNSPPAQPLTPQEQAYRAEKMRQLEVIAQSVPPDQLRDYLAGKFEARRLRAEPRKAAESASEPKPDSERRLHHRVARVIERPPAPALDDVRAAVAEGTFDTTGFEQVDFGDMHKVYLEPLDVVTGIKNIRDFAGVEEEIVSSLNPFRRDTEAAMARENIIARDRITNYLKPGQFAGRLVGGRVILLPFDMDLAGEQNKPMRRVFERYRREGKTLEGVTAIYTGLLERSVGRVGLLNVVSTYHVRPEWRGVDINQQTGSVRRTVGASPVEALDQTIVAQNLASIRRAEQLFRASLWNMSSGGLPSHGKDDRGGR